MTAAASQSSPVLLEFPLFEGVAAQTLSQLLHHAVRMHYAEDAYVWREGTSGEWVTFILDGYLKVIKSSSRGNEIICHLAGPKSSPSLVSLVPLGRHAVSGVAVTDLEALRIPNSIFRGCVRQDCRLMLNLSQALAHQHELLVQRICEVSGADAEQRLALLLLRFLEPHDPTDSCPNGAPGGMVRLHMSSGSLSDLLAVRRETVYRLLSRWKKLGLLVSVPDGFLVPDRRWLEAVSNGRFALH